MWRTAIASDSYRDATEDRAATFGSFTVVADGVGGRAGGGAAADAVMNAVRVLADQPLHPWDRVQWMVELDRRMAESGAVGETTALVVHLTHIGPIGVAVGDSVAWWVTGDEWGELTTAAKMKPWVGTGGAVPVPFSKPLQSVGTLLIATDGLVKYSSAERIVNVIRTTPFDDTPRALIELVRPPTGSGRLPDDVAVIVARWEK
mgnify:CR=1 FL=1